jgi:hypothetical protein
LLAKTNPDRLKFKAFSLLNARISHSHSCEATCF